MIEMPDLVIVGAGPVGCIIAERAATQLGWTVQIIEKRDHIAGNCYDRKDENGILIHQYGPHYFRTNDEDLLKYLSRFTDWIPGNYIVQSYTQGQYYPFPINLDTLEQFFGCTLTPDTAEAFLKTQQDAIGIPRNSEEFVLSRVGRKLYEAFYLGYTLKQWDRHPRDLDASVCGRIPVRFNRDNRYVDHPYQLMPANGYTAMFQKMIQNPNINVSLSTDYDAVKSQVKPKFGTVYCGTIDQYFNKGLGALPWRSLAFEWKTYETEYRQPCAQINYPNDYDYTRTFESKHVTGQKHELTTISYEYSRAQGDPYYPVPAPENSRLYQQYKILAHQETQLNNVYFAGRLAQYRYINMDEAMLMALETFEQLKTDALYKVAA